MTGPGNAPERSFTLYPAIDVREGRVVRLRKGDYAAETRYSDAPLSIAAEYAAQGAKWLHLVDLDAARAGGYTLVPLLTEIVSASALNVQTGGGVRTEADVQALLDAGAQRVVIGSLAVREPERVIGWLHTFGAERLTIALDARALDGRWVLPTAGWTQNSAAELIPLLLRYAEAGLKHLLSTDIDRDGMLSGPNTALYAAMAMAAPDVAVQASGGVRDTADVLAARASGCEGAVLGKALLDGLFAVDDALEAVRASTPGVRC